MRGYEVTIDDGTVELVSGADTYQQEGPLTTFFRTDAGRRVVDSWSTRVASFRTAEISRIRAVEDTCLERSAPAPSGSRIALPA